MPYPMSPQQLRALASQAAQAHAPNYTPSPEGMHLALEDMYVKAYRTALKHVSDALNNDKSLVDTFSTVI